MDMVKFAAVNTLVFMAIMAVAFILNMLLVIVAYSITPQYLAVATIVAITATIAFISLCIEYALRQRSKRI